MSSPSDHIPLYKLTNVLYLYVDYIPRFNMLKELTINDTLYQSIADDRDFDTASMYCTEEFGSSNNRGYLITNLFCISGKLDLDKLHWRLYCY